MSSDAPLNPRIPVMHNQTRQELYNVLLLLCKYKGNYAKIIELLEDVIPQGLTYSLLVSPLTLTGDSRLYLRSKLVF